MRTCANFIVAIKSVAMNFRAFWQSLTPEQKRQLATEADTSVGYLHLVAGSHRRPGPEMAKRLVAASNGKLSLPVLRPDLWGEQGAA